MKKQLLKNLCVAALGIIGLSSAANAQHWLGSISGLISSHSGDYLGKRLAVDAAGNTYSTGTYASSTNAANAKVNAYSNGQTGASGEKAFAQDLTNTFHDRNHNSYHNTFVAKTDGAGEFEWMLGIGPSVKGAASPFAVAIANTVAVDDVNNVVYIGGRFSGEIDYYYKSSVGITFAPGSIATTGNDDTDGIVIKLSKAGNYVWHKTFSTVTGTTAEGVRDVRTDAAGNLIVVGYFSGQLKIDGAPIEISGVPFTSKGGTDGFVAKFDTNGNLLFIKSIGGTGADVAYAVAIDPIDNSIYATGSANFGTVTTISVDGVDFPAAIGTSTWLAKFDTDGLVKWVQAVLSTTSQQKIAYDIAVDNDSDAENRGVYIAGTINSAATGNTFNFGGITVPIAVNPAAFPFFAKFKASGTGAGSGVWAKVFPTGDISSANVITVNDNKEVFSGGVVKGSMDFQTTGIINITTTANDAGTVQNKGYIVKFDSEDGAVLEKKIIATQGGDRVMGLVATNSALYVNGQAAGLTTVRTTGNFAGTGGDFYHRPGNGGWSTFIMKWDATTLPISLTEFKGNKTSLGNLLSWSTLSETNNEYFELERSSDGVNFSSIKRIAGAGNSTEKRNYNYLDTEPLAGINYYRLKQVDKDGAFSYSENTVAINSQLNTEGLKIYPNPGLGIVNIQLPSEAIGIEINVYNQTGKLVKSYSDLSGNSHAVDISEQTAGVYFIQVKQKGKSDFIKYIKQ